ncbi:MAG: hypothetical protein J7M40_04360, partial [Planctomycetes bacterium]|nr:hypothetical protein [Planctomycetota bacterium]
MRELILSCAVAVLVAGSPVFASFSTIQDASSGREIDLWEALDLVAPTPFGLSTSWTSTDFLNLGAGGRRLDDDLDQMWKGGDIDIAMATLYWGGAVTPLDDLRQSLVYDDTSPFGTGYTSTGVDDFMDSATLSGVGTPFIWGDDSSGARMNAWSLESLNMPTAWDDGRDGQDRMVT